MTRNFAMFVVVVLGGCHWASAGIHMRSPVVDPHVSEQASESNAEVSADSRDSESNGGAVNPPGASMDFTGEGMNGPTAGEVTNGYATVVTSDAQAHATRVMADAQGRLLDAQGRLLGAYARSIEAHPEIAPTGMLGLGVGGVMVPSSLGVIGGSLNPMGGYWRDTAHDVGVSNSTDSYVRVVAPGGLPVAIISPYSEEHFYVPLDQPDPRTGCQYYKLRVERYLPPNLAAPWRAVEKDYLFCIPWGRQIVNIVD